MLSAHKIFLFFYSIYRQVVPDKNFYIFLDMDGVLNNGLGEDGPEYITRFSRGAGTYDYVVDDVLLEFRRFAESTKARIIMQTSWFHDSSARYGFFPGGMEKKVYMPLLMSVSEFFELLMFRKQFGLNVYGQTEFSSGSKIRARSVEEFVNKYGIEHFVILDDCDYYSGTSVFHHWVETHAKTVKQSLNKAYAVYSNSYEGT